MKQGPLVWLRLTWPREVAGDQVVALWRRLPALAGWPLIVEAVGSAGQVRHRMAVTSTRQHTLMRQISAELPGISIAEDDSEPLPDLRLGADLGLSTRRRPLSTADPASRSRALLTALASTGPGEVALLQLVLGRPLHPNPTSSGSAPLSAERWSQQLGDALTGRRRPSDSEPRRALAGKQSEPGWRAVGRVAVRASTVGSEERLMRHLVGAIRSLESPGLRVLARRRRPGPVQHAELPLRWPLRLNAVEAAILSAWPIGETRTLPVAAISSRLLPPARAIPSNGRVVANASHPGGQRPLALTASASLRHAYAIGPTGVGKSTLLLNLIAQDLASGHGLVVIDPKADLIADVLARVPAERVDDVVVLDPLDEAPVGLNPLAPSGRSPELAGDAILSTFHHLSGAAWGPRVEDVLGAALLTLARVPGMTLVAVPVLLTNPSFRRRVLSQVHDPAGVGTFWTQFEAWSEAERTTAIAPVVSRLRRFLMRPSLRALLGQAAPRFDLRQVFAGKVLLVSLARGQLGPEAAALLGSLVVSELWQAVLGRSSIPAGKRRPVYAVLDEFQEYLALPVDLGDALAQARGLGLSLTLAHQHLGQLPADLRAAVLANAQSKICFRLGADDARVMAAGTDLAPDDFSGLGAYEAYVQLVAKDMVQPWASAQTLPPPPIISDPKAVRAASRRNYGVPRAEVDAGIEELLGIGPPASGSADDLKPRRRGGPR